MTKEMTKAMARTSGFDATLKMRTDAKKSTDMASKNSAAVKATETSATERPVPITWTEHGRKRDQARTGRENRALADREYGR
jgi:hypothetical protein